ncbi:hypothetical protein ACFPM0_22575 [Pseudonocardia sulfidoxydans]
MSGNSRYRDYCHSRAESTCTTSADRRTNACARRQALGTATG